MGFVVAGSALSIQRQFFLDQIEVLLTHQCWDRRDKGPLLTRGSVATRRRFAHGMGRRPSDTSRAQALSAHIDYTGVGRVGEETMQRGRAPTSLALRRYDATLQQIFGQSCQCLMLIAVAAKHLLDHCP